MSKKRSSPSRWNSWKSRLSKLKAEAKERVKIYYLSGFPEYYQIDDDATRRHRARYPRLRGNASMESLNSTLAAHSRNPAQGQAMDARSSRACYRRSSAGQDISLNPSDSFLPYIPYQPALKMGGEEEEGGYLSPAMAWHGHTSLPYSPSSITRAASPFAGPEEIFELQPAELIARKSPLHHRYRRSAPTAELHDNQRWFHAKPAPLPLSAVDRDVQTVPAELSADSIAESNRGTGELRRQDGNADLRSSFLGHQDGVSMDELDGLGDGKVAELPSSSTPPLPAITISKAVDDGDGYYGDMVQKRVGMGGYHGAYMPPSPTRPPIALCAGRWDNSEQQDS